MPYHNNLPLHSLIPFSLLLPMHLNPYIILPLHCLILCPALLLLLLFPLISSFSRSLYQPFPSFSYTVFLPASFTSVSLNLFILSFHIISVSFIFPRTLSWFPHVLVPSFPHPHSLIQLVYSTIIWSTFILFYCVPSNSSPQPKHPHSKSFIFHSFSLIFSLSIHLSFPYTSSLTPSSSTILHSLISSARIKSLIPFFTLIPHTSISFPNFQSFPFLQQKLTAQGQPQKGRTMKKKIAVRCPSKVINWVARREGQFRENPNISSSQPTIPLFPFSHHLTPSHRHSLLFTSL